MNANIQQQLLISLDYEVFFGKNTGTVHNSLIKPTNDIAQILEKHSAKLSLFVDAGYLIQLKKQGSKHPQLLDDLKAVEDQLRTLAANGHDIQLHIHPHWEDCTFDGNEWTINTDRYRLHDFNTDDQLEIVKTYKQVLANLTPKPIFAYRAGGWCIQPFEDIGNALQAEGVWLDSTVYEQGFSEDPIRWFDFRNSEKRPHWKFQKDPAKSEPNGYFTELPISAMPINPLFYWISTFMKKVFKDKYRAYGDGATMVANSAYYLTRLTQRTFSPVTLDGAKGGLLEQGYRYHLKRGAKSGVFNVMGHPKTLSKYSLEKLDQFLGKHPELSPITFQDLQYLNEAAQD